MSARCDADTHKEIDDLVRPDTEEDMVWGGQTTDFCDAALDIRMGWIWVAMKIEAKDMVELRIDGSGVPVELGRGGSGHGSGERRVVGREDGVAEGVFVRVQQDAGGVVVPRTSIRVQSEDVWSNDALDVKVRWTHRS